LIAKSSQQSKGSGVVREKLHPLRVLVEYFAINMNRKTVVSQEITDGECISLTVKG